MDGQGLRSEDFDLDADVDDHVGAAVGAVGEFDESLGLAVRYLLAHHGFDAVDVDAVTGHEIFNEKHAGHDQEITCSWHVV